MKTSRGKFFNWQAVVLVLLCLVFYFGLNYWRVSTANVDLISQIKKLELILQASDDKCQHIEQLQISTSIELKKKNSDLSVLQLSIEEKLADISKKSSLIESLNENLRLQQQAFTSQKDEHDKKIQEFKEKLDLVQSNADDSKKRADEAANQLVQKQVELDKCHTVHSVNSVLKSTTSIDNAKSPGQLPMVKSEDVHIGDTALKGGESPDVPQMDSPLLDRSMDGLNMPLAVM